METLALLKELIARPSITPDDAGIFDLLTPRLERAGFEVEILRYPDAVNLWATRGEGPYFVINGHVDVVPSGPVNTWTSDPFEAVERDGLLYGRGACDMKASVAAAVVALERTVGPAALLLTSDEEGPSHDGTSRALADLLERGVKIQSALVMEPTCEAVLGDAYKPGRRGSLTGRIVVKGVQGHVAYPERAVNAAHRLIPALAELVATEWDQGDEYFPPSTMQVFELTSGVGASNVIPGEANLGINFRHAPASSSQSLVERVEAILHKHNLDFVAIWTPSAQPFLSPPGSLAARLVEAVERVTGRTPIPKTGGGTSDARAFAAHGIESAEFGPVPIAMHGADEAVRIDSLEPLTQVIAHLI
ncbi:succinyl-diaminopimelate desuccinylase [bacterium]|nr:MAG: succinyl-diaminopimelate desuccinylase [bacterium]